MRRTPLARKTPLRRGSTRLARTRINPMSAKRRKDAPKRRAAKAAAFARDGHRCVAAALVPDVACGGPLDGHEPLTRARGGDPLDTDQIVTVCRFHHDWIDWEQDRAHDLGLLVHSWEATA